MNTPEIPKHPKMPRFSGNFITFCAGKTPTLPPRFRLASLQRVARQFSNDVFQGHLGVSRRVHRKKRHFQNWNLPQLQVKLIWSFQRCKGQCLANLPETSSHSPGKLMLAKRSFPFGMPSIPNYWFQEGETTGWGWGKDDLLTKYQRSGGQQPNATHIRLRTAGLLWCFLWNLWPSNVADLVDLHNQFSTDWFCIHSATLWAAWNDHHCSTIKRCFCFSTRCISSEASEHISNFMGIIAWHKKISLPSVQFNQSWSTLLLLPESKPELQMLQPSIWWWHCSWKNLDVTFCCSCCGKAEGPWKPLLLSQFKKQPKPLGLGRRATTKPKTIQRIHTHSWDLCHVSTASKWGNTWSYQEK